MTSWPAKLLKSLLGRKLPDPEEIPLIKHFTLQALPKKQYCYICGDLYPGEWGYWRLQDGWVTTEVVIRDWTHTKLLCPKCGLATRIVNRIHLATKPELERIAEILGL